MLAKGAYWRCPALLLCCLLLQTGTGQLASAQGTADRQQSYTLGTATTGGTYHPVGVALSTLVKLKLLPEFNVDLTAINTNGSQENAELLRQNDLQFAIMTALAGYEARTGTGAFINAGPDENLRAITTLWLSTDHFVVRQDAVKSGTVQDFLDLRGQAVSLGRDDSGTLIANSKLMSALGTDIESDFDLVELGYAESAQALVDGTIAGMSVAGAVPVGAVQDAFDQLGGQAVVLEFSDEQLALIDRGRGLWTRSTIPANTYPGQDREIFTVGSPNILAVRADVDEEVVYEITKTIFEELEYLHGLHAATQQISLDHAVDHLSLPIHEGAIRYFEEKGVELPPPPVELQSDLLVRYDGVEQARADVNAGVISLFTGADGDTSSRVAADLVSMLDGTDRNVRLLTTFGGGVGQNLTDLLYLKGVDSALVRADVLAYAEEQNVYPALQNQVTYITEMFPEEVHLLVRDDISDLSGLIGRKVNLGAAGSGTDITSSIILSQLGLRVEPVYHNAAQALDMLKQGEVDAAFFVGGKPMPLLQQVEGGAGLKLLAVPFVQYGDSYRPGEIADDDYPGLLGSGETLATVAVRTALLSYAWRPRSDRYAALSDFTDALFSSLPALQQDGHHPKWREVDPSAEFVGWRRFAPAGVWIADNPDFVEDIVSQGRQLLGGTGGDLIRSEERAAPLAAPSLDAAFTPPAPAAQTEEPSSATAPRPEARPEADSENVTVPTAPLVEILPAVDSTRSAPPANGTSYNRGPSVTSEPPAKVPNLPTTGANAPTF